MLAHAGPDPASRSPADLPALSVFRDVGWVGVQRWPDDPARHLQLVFKSSGYGSLSHSHGDQNAFLLRAFGEDLAIQSGHYVAFNSTMHQQWRRQTRSKNAILIGGKGQYAGADKVRGKAASGRLLAVEQTADAIVMTGDATAAYRSETPTVERVERTIHVVRDRYLVIVDRVELGVPTPVTWLLHGAAPFDILGTAFKMTGQRVGLYGQVVYANSGKPALSAVAGFPGVDEREIAGLAQHYHVAAEIPAAHKFSLVTLLVPYALEAPQRVLHFIDDQGYDVRISFMDTAEREYTVTLAKDL